MARRRKRPSRTGGVVVWKPVGLTSRRALEWAQTRLRVGDLGHTGTLDPLASGILVLIGGEARKFQDLLSRRDKIYQARVRLGLVSGSEDSEGPLWSTWPRPSLPSREDVDRAIESFGSGYDQIPPRFSAVRHQGKRLHELARRGEVVPEPRARSVTLHSVRVLSDEGPEWRIEVHCSSGTYIRSLARDLGERLNTGGYLSGLRRTQVGGIEESSARPLQSLRPGDWLSLEQILEPLPRVELSPEDAGRLAHGQFAQAPVEGRAQPEDGAQPSGPERVAWCEGRVVGLAKLEGDQVRPKRWLSEMASS